jgi:hypothetical protein
MDSELKDPVIRNPNIEMIKSHPYRKLTIGIQK